VERALEGIITSATSLITLYNGADADTQIAEALAARIREQFPNHEVDLHYGGQPHYDYIVSVE
jgi:dihydroxyacetone kinase-like predicted kinase